MIGSMIAKIRKDKDLTITELSRLTGIDAGHLSHIEKGERNPSHKALKNICKALEVPYQQLMYTYDKCLSDGPEDYNFVDHISYNKLLAVSSLDAFVETPSYAPSASLAIKISDDAMSPLLPINSYAFLEFNSVLNDGDIGLFELNGKFYIRKFHLRKDSITLKAENRKIPDVSITDKDTFFIVGRIMNHA